MNPYQFSSRHYFEHVHQKVVSGFAKVYTILVTNALCCSCVWDYVDENSLLANKQIYVKQSFSDKRG